MLRPGASAAVTTAVLAVALLTPGCSAEETTPVVAPAGTSTTAPAEKGVPTLRIRTVADGLDHPWDVKPIGAGRLLFTQRDRASLSLWDHGEISKVAFPTDQVWVSGETGLMGLEVDPDFADNRRFYTCQGATTDGGHDVRVKAWRLNDDATRAKKRGTLVKGLPATTGRHGGCRLLVSDDGWLHVGTGDAATGTNPRDLTSLGGKTLRLDRFTGKPADGNPFRHAKNKRKQYVFTYGHRNVQGLAQRKDGTVWSIEQGSYRDDEVNLLRKGGDYGWNPVPGYNEDVPMTDQSLPGKQLAARWSSGDPTLATCGGTFVYGKEWGALRGSLAVAVLKSEQVLFLTFDEDGRLQHTRTPDALRQYGRIRQVVQDRNGSLLVLTDNGDGNDVMLRVSPA